MKWFPFSIPLVVFFAIQNLMAYDFKPREIRVRTTAYTHTESDHLGFGRKTAIGTNLRSSREYTSAAADWSRFPVGTEFRIAGINRHFVIDDYGWALTGKDTIDLYFTSKKEMNRWGARHVDIIITKYGDYEKSKRILAHRTKWSHCRRMLADIKKNQENYSGKTYKDIPVPWISKAIDPTLMASASIPRSEWDLSAPDVESDYSGMPFFDITPAGPSDIIPVSLEPGTDIYLSRAKSPEPLSSEAQFANIDRVRFDDAGIELPEIETVDLGVIDMEIASIEPEVIEVASLEMAEFMTPAPVRPVSVPSKQKKIESSSQTKTSTVKLASNSRSAASSSGSKKTANPLRKIGRFLSGSTLASKKSPKKRTKRKAPVFKSRYAKV